MYKPCNVNVCQWLKVIKAKIPKFPAVIRGESSLKGLWIDEQLGFCVYSSLRDNTEVISAQITEVFHLLYIFESSVNKNTW